MIGNYFTKPLHGSLFRKSCDLIIGIEEEYVTKYNTKSHEWIKDNKQKKSTNTNSIKAGVGKHRGVLG